LIGLDPAGQDSISTLLGTLGWTCTSVSAQDDIVGTVERDSFDAVLLDLSHDGTGAERIILGIREVRPSLSERIMVICGSGGDSGIVELVERYDLPHLFRESVLSRVWSALENLLVAPTLCKPAPRSLQMARLQSDKKTQNGVVHFILPREIGKVEVASDVPSSAVVDAVEELRRLSRGGWVWEKQ